MLHTTAQLHAQIKDFVAELEVGHEIVVTTTLGKPATPYEVTNVLRADGSLTEVELVGRYGATKSLICDSVSCVIGSSSGGRWRGRTVNALDVFDPDASTPTPASDEPTWTPVEDLGPGGYVIETDNRTGRARARSSSKTSMTFDSIAQAVDAAWRDFYDRVYGELRAREGDLEWIRSTCVPRDVVVGDYANLRAELAGLALRAGRAQVAKHDAYREAIEAGGKLPPAPPFEHRGRG